MVNLKGLTTESRNPKSENFSSMSVADAVALMNQEDLCCVKAVEKASERITKVIENTAGAFTSGGRIIYIGAGTSGRLGVLDAVECPPTFGVDYDVVVGLIAGGENAFVKAKEGAEDSQEQGKMALEEIGLKSADAVIGIAASGRTPYVIGALKYAQSLGCFTGAVVCNDNSPIGEVCENTIVLNVGPEVLTGSTRLKSGTATKMVLNMISTIYMRDAGKIYKNYMVDVKMTNEKLRARGAGIVKAITGAEDGVIQNALEQSGQQVKTAIVMIEQDVNADTARDLLEKAGGHIDRIERKDC